MFACAQVSFVIRMLQLLIDYAIPAGLFLLMLIAGTEVRIADVRKVAATPRALALGSIGQLLALPMIALLIQALAQLSQVVATSMLILALAPGGGISNYYSYVARCNVLLSAMITTSATLLALVTIPSFISLFPDLFGQTQRVQEGAVRIILAQLFLLMVMSLLIGALLANGFPTIVKKYGTSLRAISNLLVLSILLLAIWTTYPTLGSLLPEILSAAILFVVAAMLTGWLFGAGLNDDVRTVLVLESGTRNISVALLLGGIVFDTKSFPVFASFLTVYFAVELITMLIYARGHGRRVELSCGTSERD